MSDFFGLDIGQNSIKLVLLYKGDKMITLGNLGEARTPVMDVKNEDDRDKFFDELAKIVKTMLVDLKIREKQVVVSLPEDEVISRLVRLPPLKDSEIMDALRFEAETFVPYPLDEVSIDYEIIEKDDAGRLTVFVIAARNDLIQRYVKLCKSMGLELMALESPSVALKRVVGNSIKTVGRLIVLDLGEKYSDLFGINKGSTYFVRSLPLGGESFTRAISLNLGLDMASAEEYKKAYGIKEMELEGKIKSAIMPVFNNVAEEVRKAMALFMEENGGNPIELLVLSGGGANLPGMAEELTKILGVEVQVIQPFVNIDVTKAKVPVNLNTDGCRFALAAGLSMRGLL